MKNLTVVQLQLGRSSSLLTAQRFDGTFSDLHHVVELGHGGVVGLLGQVLGHHARVHRLVGGGLGRGVVQGEGPPQARVVGARHHVAVVRHRRHHLGAGGVRRHHLLLKTIL